MFHVEQFLARLYPGLSGRLVAFVGGPIKGAINELPSRPPGYFSFYKYSY